MMNSKWVEDINIFCPIQLWVDGVVFDGLMDKGHPHGGGFFILPDCEVDHPPIIAPNLSSSGAATGDEPYQYLPERPMGDSDEELLETNSLPVLETGQEVTLYLTAWQLAVACRVAKTSRDSEGLLLYVELQYTLAQCRDPKLQECMSMLW